MLGLGLGAVIRNTAGAVGTLIGSLFGLQLLVALVPASVSDHVYTYLPAPAGLAVTEVRPDSSALSPGSAWASSAGTRPSCSRSAPTVCAAADV